MPRALKACGTCGTPSASSTCGPCSSGQHQLTRTQRGYDNEWLRLAAQAKKRQPWCAWPLGCVLPIDDSNPLTGDHDVPLVRAPHRRLDPTNVVVLCRTHNSRKGDRTLDEIRSAEGVGGHRGTNRGPEPPG